jgi:hypothetical protein
VNDNDTIPLMDVPEGFEPRLAFYSAIVGAGFSVACYLLSKTARKGAIVGSNNGLLDYFVDKKVVKA